MTAVGIRLQLLRRKLQEPEQLRLLGDVEATIELTISRLRHLLFELRPPALDRDGLTAMRERVELAGGSVRIESAPQTGTVVECWLPSLAPDEDGARRRG